MPTNELHRITPTRELILKEADGTITHEERDLLERRRSNEAEMADASLYQQNFKPRCVRCSLKIDATWEHYRVLGNYCQTCSTELGRRAL